MIGKRIEIVVSPDGSLRVETKGFSGSECQEASRFLEQALGQKQKEQLTAEFYRTGVVEHQQVRQRQ